MGLHVQIQKILTWEGPRDIEVFQGDPRQISVVLLCKLNPATPRPPLNLCIDLYV